jgi:hypothetical protein
MNKGLAFVLLLMATAGWWRDAGAAVGDPDTVTSSGREQGIAPQVLVIVDIFIAQHQTIDSLRQ